MTYKRIVVAAVADTIVFLTHGFRVRGWLIAREYIPFPEGVHRSGDAARRHVPLGLTGLFVAITLFATVYAKGYEPGRVAGKGASLGFLFGSSWQVRS
jgi:hypothetical protein